MLHFKYLSYKRKLQKKFITTLEELKKFRSKTKPIVLVTGCVAQAEGDVMLKKENYIDAVIGPQSYHQINTMIKKLEKSLVI